MSMRTLKPFALVALLALAAAPSVPVGADPDDKTLVLLPFGAAHWRYREDGSPVGHDSTTWPVGVAPFGRTSVECGFAAATGTTGWTTMRIEFLVPEKSRDLRLTIRGNTPNGGWVIHRLPLIGGAPNVADGAIASDMDDSLPRYCPGRGIDAPLIVHLPEGWPAGRYQLTAWFDADPFRGTYPPLLDFELTGSGRALDACVEPAKQCAFVTYDSMIQELYAPQAGISATGDLVSIDQWSIRIDLPNGNFLLPPDVYLAQARGVFPLPSETAPLAGIKVQFTKGANLQHASADAASRLLGTPVASLWNAQLHYYDGGIERAHLPFVAVLRA